MNSIFVRLWGFYAALLRGDQEAWQTLRSLRRIVTSVLIAAIVALVTAASCSERYVWFVGIWIASRMYPEGIHTGDGAPEFVIVSLGVTIAFWAGVILILDAGAFWTLDSNGPVPRGGPVSPTGKRSSTEGRLAQAGF